MTSPYGLHRVREPEGVLPQQAWRLDADPTPGADEVVVDVERRESNYGVYYVYKLSPNGAFWVREEEPKYAKGDIVAARVDAKTGRAKITKQLRLGR